MIGRILIELISIFLVSAHVGLEQCWRVLYCGYQFITHPIMPVTEQPTVISSRRAIETFPPIIVALVNLDYIQRDGKNSSIVSSVGTSKVRKSLQRVFDELNAPEFIFIDRGYIVNIVQIMKVSDSIAILKNGDQLPISRSHLQEVKRQINQFWGAHI